MKKSLSMTVKKLASSVVCGSLWHIICKCLLLQSADWKVLDTQKLEICVPWRLLLLWGGLSSTLLVCSRISSDLNASTFFVIHFFVYMWSGHFSLSEYVIMLDIDLCRKIPGHDKCTRWICNQQRVSLLYPTWPPFQLMNSCLAGNFLLENTITSVVYVLLASNLCIHNCQEIPRYKTFESRFTICLLVCLF